MIRLEGALVRLRALEPADADLLYAWENDTEVWSVSGTTAPFSRQVLARFIAEQSADLVRTGQLRLIVERRRGAQPVGTVDLFEYEPLHRRAGIGILIHPASERRRGYASEALRLVCDYAFGVLDLHQLWCGVQVSNAASLGLFRTQGFQLTGLRKAWNRTPEGWQDEYLLQRIRTE